jgi:hypothetical protein
MKISGKVDWWPREPLTHKVLDGVLIDGDHLSFDLEEDAHKWQGKMTLTSANCYEGVFQKGNGETARAWGHLRIVSSNERVLIGEWIEKGEEHIFIVEIYTGD